MPFYYFRRQHSTPVATGFTLIELMVVLAIIGILSAVVLAVLSTPRAKGSDAAIKANFRGIQSQAQIFLDNNNGKYNTDGATGVAATPTVCPTTGNTMFAADATIKAAIAASNSSSGGSATCYMNSTGTAYLIWSPLKTSGTYWCIDQTGIAKPEAAAQVAQTTCP